MFQLAPPPPVGPQGVGGSTEGGGGGGLLRIAYMSSDFGDHTTGVNIGGIFKEHDSSRVKVFGYATSEDDGSAVRQRIERECHVFRDLHELRCVYVCIQCIHMSVYMYVCNRVNVMCFVTCTNSGVYICVYNVYTCLYACTYTYAYTYTYILVYTYTYIYILVSAHAYIHGYTHIYIYIYA